MSCFCRCITLSAVPAYSLLMIRYSPSTLLRGPSQNGRPQSTSFVYNLLAHYLDPCTALSAQNPNIKALRSVEVLLTSPYGIPSRSRFWFLCKLRPHASYIFTKRILLSSNILPWVRAKYDEDLGRVINTT